MAKKWSLICLLAGLWVTAGSAEASAPPPPELADIPHLLLTDMNSGQVLYESQAGTRFLPASMTKVMTAYVAFEEMKAGRLRPATAFTISQAVAQQWSGKGTTLYLRPGERVPVDSLLRGITVVSANDAAAALAEGAAGDMPRWLGMMNAHARRLGMNGSHFASPNGLPDEGRTYVTALDLARLTRAMIVSHPALYRRYFGQKSFIWRGETFGNRDPTLGVVPGADGIKTGHTLEAGYNFLGSAERQGHRLIMVVGGAPSETVRAAASRALMEWGFSAWETRPLFAPGMTIGTARVQEGSARSVPLVASHAVMASLPKGSNAPVRLRIVYRGPVAAPIAKGAEIARLEIRVGDMAPGVVPLYAGRHVARAGLIDRVWNGLAGLFS